MDDDGRGSIMFVSEEGGGLDREPSIDRPRYQTFRAESCRYLSSNRHWGGRMILGDGMPRLKGGVAETKVWIRG
jgi:hypothetical protein